MGVSEPEARNFMPLTTLMTQVATGVLANSGLVHRAPPTRPSALIVKATFILPFLSEVRLHVRTWANEARMTLWTSSLVSLLPPASAAGLAAGLADAVLVSVLAAGFADAVLVSVLAVDLAVAVLVSVLAVDLGFSSAAGLVSSAGLASSAGLVSSAGLASSAGLVSSAGLAYSAGLASSAGLAAARPLPWASAALGAAGGATPRSACCACCKTAAALSVAA